MEIIKEIEGEKLVVTINGRVDSSTAPALERDLLPTIKDVKSVVLQAANLAYISSAGLRVLLKIRKELPEGDSIIIRNMNDSVKQILEMTGFEDMFVIE